MSTLSVHISGNFTYYNCCVQHAGWCVCVGGLQLCSAGRLPLDVVCVVCMCCLLLYIFSLVGSPAQAKPHQELSKCMA